MFARRSPEGAAVLADGLVLGYGRHVALEEATFAVPVGASVALIGPNGSGKSTVLRALAGVLSPRAGRLEVPALARRAAVALVLQTTDVDRSLPITVREAVTLARYARLGPWRPQRREDRAAVDGALERLDVADLASRQLHELSGGQRQRVLVAQGLAQGAELVLLDEPVTGLDAVSRDLILQAVTAERAAGRTVVLSTHDFADARRCDLVLLLANRVVAFGPPGEVLTDGPLTEAYGSQVLRFEDGSVVLDDPHHAHPSQEHQAHDEAGGAARGA
ncbi:MAG: ATP-binding cassette domain-containing protein [Acidimicrobiia bacterium]|nr:ATP-binding cassette domain-containing protein [Acidimicrobiia bacterium]